ncbi:hypothetical protein BGX23_003916, partial [Mortierella sp. AD031]
MGPGEDAVVDGSPELGDEAGVPLAGYLDTGEEVWRGQVGRDEVEEFWNLEGYLYHWL